MDSNHADAFIAAESAKGAEDAGLQTSWSAEERPVALDKTAVRAKDQRQNTRSFFRSEYVSKLPPSKGF